MKKSAERKKFVLDNAAKIYTAAMTKKWNQVYRVSVYLKETIDAAVLNKAANDLRPRFPSFYARLHKGFKWDSLVSIDNTFKVEPEVECPCRPFDMSDYSKPLFRVLYRNNRISAEFFHSITDGTGATVYIKTLVARYLELKGCKIEKTSEILDLKDEASDSETEDAFQSIYKKTKRISRAEANAYQYLPKREENYLRAVSGVMPVAEMKRVAKEKYNCGITAYIAAAYAYAFLQQWQKETDKSHYHKRPIKLSIPVNLRQYYKKRTLRNFSSFVNVTVDPKLCETFSEVIETVKLEMMLLIKQDRIEKAVNQNVAEEKMLITKVAPNVLKKVVMKKAYYNFGERKYTSPLSNLGNITVPQSMREYVERFEFILGETIKNSVYCAVAGYGDKLTITISCVTKNTAIEDAFFDVFKKDGISFPIEAV